MEDFLKHICQILERNEELVKLKQESFNVFSILRNEHDEENLHTSFLCELLNPGGSHQLGDSFLKIFTQTLGIEDKFDISNSRYVKVYREKGFENGRLDICIENVKREVIVIENKINAVDQMEQLIRYHKYIVNKAKSGVLLYLTLQGNEAAKNSTCNGSKELRAGKDYLCVSYQSEIIEWLDRCMKEAADSPTVRETIKQYIYLIKKITGQLSNEMMEKEMTDQLIKNYAVARKIADNLWKAEQKVVQQFFEGLKRKIGETITESDWDITLSDNLFEMWGGINISSKNWGEGIFVNITGQSRILNHHCAMGIIAPASLYDRQIVNNSLEKKLRDEYEKSSEIFPFYHLRFDISPPEKKELLCDETKRNQLIEETANRLINLAQAADEKLAEMKPIK